MCEYYNENGELRNSEETIYKKNQESKVTRKQNVDGKIVLESITEYTRKKGFTTETSNYYDENGSVTGKNVEKYKIDKAGNRIYSWKKFYSMGKLISSYTYKYKMYKKGAAKGCINEEIEIQDGKEVKKSEYKIKVVKSKL